MTSQLKLLDLFGDFIGRWPATHIFQDSGFNVTATSVAAWLGHLNDAAQLSAVRTGATDDRVAVEAKLHATWPVALPDGFPFALGSMPDVQFYVPNIPVASPVQLLVSQSDQGVEVILEGLPLEIRLPAGLIIPPDSPPPDPSDPTPPGVPWRKTVGSFSAGTLDALEITYTEDQSSVVKVHVRLHVDENLQITLHPVVPISFGKCKFMQLPCTAVHDFSLIPSPSRSLSTMEWLRHDIKPWVSPFQDSPYEGAYAARSLDLDPQSEPISSLVGWLKNHRDGASSEAATPDPEFVLEDLVVPFWSPWVVPIPRHVTVGLRRKLEDPTNLAQVYSFEGAPVNLRVCSDPYIGMFIEKIFYISQPSETVTEGLDPGLRLSGGIYFGQPHSEQHAILFGVEENLTVRAGYARDFGADGLPDADSAMGRILQRVLHWEIASITIDIMAVWAGYAIGKAVKDRAGFGDCAELVGDLFIYMPPTGGDDSFFRLRALNGQRVAFRIESLGWKQGAFNLEGLTLPDGVVIYFGPVGIILQEIGLVAEQGASYLNFSAGINVQIPSGFEGGVGVKNLRFRVAGNPDAPLWQMDGIFVRLNMPNVILVEAGGYYTDKEVVIDTVTWHVKEFGLTGTLDLSPLKYKFGLDLIVGHTKSPGQEFRYFMFQVFFQGSLAIGTFTIRGARLLFARNMIPKLGEYKEGQGELRYLGWYKKTNPVTVSGDRRLAAWQAADDAWSVGVGLQFSVTGMGRIAELGGFVLFVYSEPEKGLLVVVEFFALSSTTPIAYGVLELDFENGQYSFLAGMELTFKNFWKNCPGWLNKIAKLTGTLLISSKPLIVALGRLNDQRTWLSMVVDFQFWGGVHCFFGLCFEYNDTEAGSKGGGLVVRLEGSIDAGVVAIKFHLGFGFIIAFFSTGSKDYSLVIWIEGGIRAVILFFLRFGISARIQLDVMGKAPTRTDLSIVFKFETPWFLPDITWRMQWSWGRLEPESLAVAVSPLQLGSALQEVTGDTHALHNERFDRDWTGERNQDGSGASKGLAIKNMNGAGADETTRLAAFHNSAEVRPIPTDAGVAIEFSVPLKDGLGLDVAAGVENFGDQQSEDLTLSYELTGLKITRRPRFKPGAAWVNAETQLVLGPDFSDPAGVALDGTFDPTVFTKFWDTSRRRDDKPAAKMLVINAATAFAFQTENPEQDERTLRDNPNWPCCNWQEKRIGRQTIHEVIFRDDTPGSDAAASRFFSDSLSRFAILPEAHVRPTQFGGSLVPGGALVAAIQANRPGPLLRADLETEAAICWFRLAWLVRHAATLRLAAYDADYHLVGEKQVALSGSSPFQTLVLTASGPIRTVEAQLLYDRSWWAMSTENTQMEDDLKGRGLVELDRVAYLTLAEYLQEVSRDGNCDPTDDDFQRAYSGKGKVFFLPNHEYAIEVLTKVGIKHTSTDTVANTVNEFLYFATKGLPGLNAQKRVGEEVQPYVHRTYDGGRGVLYREEPACLQFTEDLSVAVPIAQRPPGSANEHDTLFEMALTVQPKVATEPQSAFTTTALDWIVDHRSLALVSEFMGAWRPTLADSTQLAVDGISLNPNLARLARLTQRPGAPCALPDPREVLMPVLAAMPQGDIDPDDPTRPLWPAGAIMNAVVRPKAAGFVYRPNFTTADKTAFVFAKKDAPGGSGDWTVNTGGELRCARSNKWRYALFGESSWNHLDVQVGIRLDGQGAGVGFALPGTSDHPVSGMLAMVEAQGSGHQLVVYRRTAGGDFLARASEKKAVQVNDGEAALHITAFDDCLRLALGETVLEVDRDTHREGRLCLVSNGRNRFTRLLVRGLAIYQFPFATSQYRSFADHIDSFEGKLDAISPGAMGGAGSAPSVSSLWSAEGGQIQTLMTPEADPATRQVCFTQWVERLGVPLKEVVTGLGITRYDSGGKVQAFLLESPEPLDFTTEISLTLRKRVRVSGGLAPIGSILERGVRLSDLLAVKRWEVGPDPIPESPPGLLEELLGTPDRPPQPRPTVSGPRLTELMIERPSVFEPPPAIGIWDMINTQQEIILNLESIRHESLRPNREYLLAETAKTSQGKTVLCFYRGRLTISGEGACITARKSAETLTVGADSLAKAPNGTVLVLDPDRKTLLDWFAPTYKWVDQKVAILQDGKGLRAMVIPLSGTHHQALSTGRYRLIFEIDRSRWDTTDAPDDLNRYQGQAQISLRL